MLDSGLVDDEGWHDLGFGLKYVLLAARAPDAAQRRRADQPP